MTHEATVPTRAVQAVVKMVLVTVLVDAGLIVPVLFARIIVATATVNNPTHIVMVDLASCLLQPAAGTTPARVVLVVTTVPKIAIVQVQHAVPTARVL